MFHEDAGPPRPNRVLRLGKQVRPCTVPRSNRNEGDRNGRRSSTAPAGRTAYRRGQRVGRSPGLRYRTGSRPWDSPPPSALRVLGRAAKPWEPTGGEVVDDFPEQLPVLLVELKVIETYLARLLDESFEPGTLETNSSEIEIMMWNRANRDK